MFIIATINIIITISTWTLLSINNPINLRLIIIIIAIIISILIGLIISPWYAIIIFLIYVGGIIVIFSYFIRLSSNDSIIIKTKLHFIILPFITIKILKLQTLIPQYTRIEINKLYIYNNTIIILLITIILLIIILFVIKIVKTNNGPLRGFNKKIPQYQ